MPHLYDAVTALKGVGPAKAKLFAALNIHTVFDLLSHFPRDYEDRTKLVTISQLEVDVPACFRAMVTQAPRTSHIRKGMDITKVQISDHTARLNLTFLTKPLPPPTFATEKNIFSMAKPPGISLDTP